MIIRKIIFPSSHYLTRRVEPLYADNIKLIVAINLRDSAASVVDIALDIARDRVDATYNSRYIRHPLSVACLLDPHLIY